MAASTLMFFWLLVGHALADWPLQGDRLSRAKRGLVSGVPPWLALGWHALIHAAAVYFVTESALLALAEWMAHYIVDFEKCRGQIGLVLDQVLHVCCKGLWVLMFGMML